MKKCILFHNKIDFSKSGQFTEYNKLNFYEYLFSLYNTFNLENHEAETLIPLSYENDIRLIIDGDSKEEYLSKSNIVTFECIFNRVVKKFEANEALKENVLLGSVFVMKSLDLSVLERDFVAYLMRLNHSGVYICTDDNFVSLTVDMLEEMHIMPIIISNKEDDTAKLLIAYLSVAINVRDQLHFSYIFNVPDRQLTHHAFTNLRHEATRTKMAMPQVALSFVTKLRLGGLSYAPASDYVLNKYVAGLSQLVAVINSLYSVMEDHCCETDKVAVVTRMLRTVQKCLVDDKSARFTRRHVEATRERMTRTMTQLVAQDESIIIENNAAPLKAIVSVIRRLIGHYATCFHEYEDCAPMNSLASPSISKTPKGGCSKDIALLYMSPHTMDSPMITKKKKYNDSSNDSHLTADSESMPMWPLHCKYQSNLNWAPANMTPPHIVKKQADRTRSVIDLPAFDLNNYDDDDAIDEEIFKHLTKSKDKEINAHEETTNPNKSLQDDEINKKSEKEVNLPKKRASVSSDTKSKLVADKEKIVKPRPSKKILGENNGDMTQSYVKGTAKTNLPKKRTSVVNDSQKNGKKQKLVPGQKLITSFLSK